MKVLLHSIILQLLCVCTLTSTQHVVLPVCTPSQPDIYFYGALCSGNGTSSPNIPTVLKELVEGA